MQMPRKQQPALTSALSQMPRFSLLLQRPLLSTGNQTVQGAWLKQQIEKRQYNRCQTALHC